ncbi:MAG: type II toxin-antitoxin system RelE/ParE family toxin [Synergistaceae bacterium]|nr:type II toxin-antitoxin system RelE/ParE family toxin [Synergistaceae bacterium]MBQ6981215.1 type II toxin-antitoxin system RelE/ParE family toxin [Synergistaceae bacterium]
MHEHGKTESMTAQYSILHYTENGRDVFDDWIKSLRDKRGQSAIYKRIDRVEEGHFGEHKPCREGVWELIIDYGPGYRIYYSITGKTIILLLCAGDKSSQQKDINKAIEYLSKYKEEHS